MSMSTPRLVAVLAFAFMLSVAGHQPPPSATPTVKLARAVTAEASEARGDEPGSAAELDRLKRQGPGPGFDPVAALAAARRHRARMPVHATAAAARSGQPGAGEVKGWPALATWQALGPGNIGGRTRTLVIHPDDHQVMYCGGVSGGVWKTTDGGQWWRPLADDLANIAVNSMAMHPTDPEVLYVGTGEGYFREEVRGTWLPLRGAGIFRTDDSGETWRQLPATGSPDFHWVNDLVTTADQPDRLYAATRSGVWRSEDRGETWEQILASDEHGGCLDLALRTDTAADWLYAACGTLDQATVYRRVMSGGGQWEAVLSEPGMGRTTLAIAPSDQRVVYALAASNLPGPDGHFEQGLLAVYRSTAAGDAGSWQVRVDNIDPVKLNTLLLANPAAASYRDCGWYSENRWINMGWYANVIAVDPVDPDLVWAAGVDLFRSDDGGSSWGLASYWWLDETWDAFAHADQHAIVFHPDYDGLLNRRMLVANDGGVFITNDARAPVAQGEDAVCDPYLTGMRWASLNHNLGITQFYHGVPFPGAETFIGGTQDNGTVRGTAGAGHEGWLQVLGGDGGYVAVDPTDPDLVYAETQRFYFNKSVDGGYSFHPARSGVTEPDSAYLFITPFVMDPGDPRRLWAGGHRIWRTDNAAGRWQAASTLLSSTAKISAIAVHPADSQTVLVGTSEGSIHRNDRALEAGASTGWPAVRPRDGFVSWIAHDPISSEVVYASYAGFGGPHLWRSRDGGSSWQPIDGSGDSALPDIPVHSVAVDPTDTANLYLGTDLGVFTSQDGGEQWAVENTGFATAVTEALELGSDAAGNPWLFAFTHGRGAWRVALGPELAAPRTPRGRLAP
jgi:photosystem II stability/assembly factor-like uncharacterized protein